MAPDTDDGPPPDAPENLRVRWWRARIAGLTQVELAERIGYSEISVRKIEAGSMPIEPRFRLACAAVEAGLEDWAWTEAGRRRRR